MTLHDQTAWVTSPLLIPTRPPPAIGANGLAFNNEHTALFVANTAQDTIIKIPVSGSPLEPGTPEVFVNRAGGGPDGIIIDEHDNIWIACNQSDEVMVLEPTQGRLIAHRVSLVEQPRLSRRRRAGHRPLGRHQRYVVQKSADR